MEPMQNIRTQGNLYFHKIPYPTYNWLITVPTSSIIFQKLDRWIIEHVFPVDVENLSNYLQFPISIISMIASAINRITKIKGWVASTGGAVSSFLEDYGMHYGMRVVGCLATVVRVQTNTVTKRNTRRQGGWGGAKEKRVARRGYQCSFSSRSAYARRINCALHPPWEKPPTASIRPWSLATDSRCHATFKSTAASIL